MAEVFCPMSELNGMQHLSGLKIELVPLFVLENPTSRTKRELTNKRAAKRIGARPLPPWSNASVTPGP